MPQRRQEGGKGAKLRGKSKTGSAYAVRAVHLPWSLVATCAQHLMQSSAIVCRRPSGSPWAAKSQVPIPARLGHVAGLAAKAHRRAHYQLFGIKARATAHDALSRQVAGQSGAVGFVYTGLAVGPLPDVAGQVVEARYACVYFRAAERLDLGCDRAGGGFVDVGLGGVPQITLGILHVRRDGQPVGGKIPLGLSRQAAAHEVAKGFWGNRTRRS